MDTISLPQRAPFLALMQQPGDPWHVLQAAVKASGFRYRLDEQPARRSPKHFDAEGLLRSDVTDADQIEDIFHQGRPVHTLVILDAAHEEEWLDLLQRAAALQIRNAQRDYLVLNSPESHRSRDRVISVCFMDQHEGYQVQIGEGGKVWPYQLCDAYRAKIKKLARPPLTTRADARYVFFDKLAPTRQKEDAEGRVFLTLGRGYDPWHVVAIAGYAWGKRGVGLELSRRVGLEIRGKKRDATLSLWSFPAVPDDSYSLGGGGKRAIEQAAAPSVDLEGNDTAGDRDALDILAWKQSRQSVGTALAPIAARDEEDARRVKADALWGLAHAAVVEKGKRGKRYHTLLDLLRQFSTSERREFKTKGDYEQLAAAVGMSVQWVRGSIDLCFKRAGCLQQKRVAERGKILAGGRGYVHVSLWEKEWTKAFVGQVWRPTIYPPVLADRGWHSYERENGATGSNPVGGVGALTSTDAANYDVSSPYSQPGARGTCGGTVRVWVDGELVRYVEDTASKRVTTDWPTGMQHSQFRTITLAHHGNTSGGCSAFCSACGEEERKRHADAWQAALARIAVSDRQWYGGEGSYLPSSPVIQKWMAWLEGEGRKEGATAKHHRRMLVEVREVFDALDRYKQKGAWPEDWYAKIERAGATRGPKRYNTSSSRLIEPLGVFLPGDASVKSAATWKPSRWPKVERVAFGEHQSKCRAPWCGCGAVAERAEVPLSLCISYRWGGVDLPGGDGAWPSSNTILRPPPTCAHDAYHVSEDGVDCASCAYHRELSRFSIPYGTEETADKRLDLGAVILPRSDGARNRRRKRGGEGEDEAKEMLLGPALSGIWATK